MKKTYFVATFTALIEADSEAEAAKQAKGAAEAIDEYIGSMCNSDPWMYRTKSEGVVPYNGPDPFGDEGERMKDTRATAEEVRGLYKRTAR